MLSSKKFKILLLCINLSAIFFVVFISSPSQIDKNVMMNKCIHLNSTQTTTTTTTTTSLFDSSSFSTFHKDWEQFHVEKKMINSNFQKIEASIESEKDKIKFVKDFSILEDYLGNEENITSVNRLVAIRLLLNALHKQLGGLWCNIHGVGPTGGFCMKKGMKIHFDPNLATELGRVFKDKTVYDFGARTGLYARHFVEQCGALMSVAIDGAPNVEEFTQGNVTWADLSVEQDWPPFDWVMSLEVGEHIPAEYEDIFIDNLHRHNKEGIILSWAVPNQKGSNHVNNHPNEYIKDKLFNMGYNNDAELEHHLRKSATKATWFRKTLMVFRRKKNV